MRCVQKNFFKLSHGEYVAAGLCPEPMLVCIGLTLCLCGTSSDCRHNILAEKLENMYKKSTFVDQIWVYGDSEKSQLVAVVVPDAAGLSGVAAEIGKSGDVAVCIAVHMQQMIGIVKHKSFAIVSFGRILQWSILSCRSSAKMQSWQQRSRHVWKLPAGKMA